MDTYYLGFDAGTQSVKVAVYNINMECIASDVNATQLNYPHPDWVEMDAVMETCIPISYVTI